MKEILALEHKSSNWIQCNKISIADLKILTAKVIFYTCSVEQISLQFVEVYFFSSGTKVAQKGFVSQICVLQAQDNVFLWLAVYFGVMHVSPAASWSPPYPSISSLWLLYIKLPQWFFFIVVHWSTWKFRLLSTLCI